MRLLRLAIASAVLLVGPSAWADTFGFDYSAVPSINPTLDFEADCLSASPAEDCPERAAALEAELLDVLAQLSDNSEPDTIALFESVGEMNDARLKEVSLRYLAEHNAAPTGLMATISEFFFGPDSRLGQPSATILSQSSGEPEQELASVYLEGRPSSEYGGSLPEGAGFTDSWATASVKDSFLDEHASFTDAELFPDATRLLMVNSFNRDVFDTSGVFDDPTTQFPVTGFVTQAPLEDVAAHFTELFGRDPYPPAAIAEVRLAELSGELQDLVERLAAGDQSAGAELEALSKEMEVVQAGASLAGLLNLTQLGCANHEFWSNASLSSTTSQRAVVAGYDARVDAVVIRYIGGAVADAEPGSGSGGAGGDDDDNVAGGNGDGEESPRAVKKDDSGCSCSMPSQGGLGTPLWLLGLVALRRALRRPRR